MRSGGIPLNTNRVTIGTATVLMLVLLRLALGCHFLYEGVWKIEHADKFSAAPFLSEAKGPASRFFYAMLPDLNGRERLGAEKDDKGHWKLAMARDDRDNQRLTVIKDEKGPVVAGKGRPMYEAEAERIDAWAAFQDDVAKKYRFSQEQIDADQGDLRQVRRLVAELLHPQRPEVPDLPGEPRTV